MTIEKAKDLLEKGDVEQGKEILLNIARGNPTDVRAWLLLCGISTRTSNWTLGLESFEQLVKLRPSSSLATSGLVQCYLNSGKYSEALSEIERFKNISKPENDEVQTVLDEHKKIAAKIEQLDDDK